MTSRASVRFVAALGVLALLALVFLRVPAFAADPDALWKIVHGACAPDEALTGQAAPCLAVDLAGGYAVLKDRRGATQVLVIPTARVTGIESPELLRPGAPNYWDDAWRARGFVEKLAGRPIPRDDLAMVVNSEEARSQNQLHIHVDCVRADVKDALSRALPQIGPHWRDVGVGLAGHRYAAMRLMGDDLGSRDPFKLLAEGQPLARADMGPETLVVTGAVFPGGAPGFVLLADRAAPALGDSAAGEELMDHACAVLAPARPPSPPPSPDPG